MAKRRRSRARRRMPPRNARGRFMKRGSSVRRKRRRPIARRAAPRRARRSAPRRHYHRRRGRFVSERKAHYTPKYIARARRRRSKSGKHLRAVHKIGAGSRVAGLVRLNPREMMALSNPRRRRRRHLRVHHPRRRHHRHVRRNPGFGGIIGVVKASTPMVVGGLAGGVASGLLDTTLLAEKPTAIRLAVKGAAAVAAEAFLRGRHPRVAAGLSGGLFGSLGYDAGLTAGGGMVAHTPKDALKKVALRGLEDPEMAAMMGDSVDREMLSDIVDQLGEDGELRDIVDQISE